MNPVKKPQLSDGTGINLKSLIDFVRCAHTDLEGQGFEEPAHYFEMFLDYLQNDVASNKPFRYSSKVLGL